MSSESEKWGWQHVSIFGRFDKGSGTKRWRCNHCNLRYNGSYSRVRAHLLGFTGVGIKSCPAIDGSLREAFHILEEERLTRKKKLTSGSAKPSKRIRISRSTLPDTTKEDMDEIVARFFYVHALSVNAANSPYFLDMVKAIGCFGPGYEPPSVDELSDSFLSRERGRIEKSLALVRESWPHTGCTILCVGCLESMLGCFHINIFISNPRGLMYLKAVDIDDIDGADNVFSGVLGDIIMEVGPRNVLQIISHLDDTSKLSDSLMLSSFPHIFWSPCTSNSICMLMEEIAEMDLLKPVVLCAKEIKHCITTYQQFSPCSFNQNMEGSSDPPSMKFAPSFCIVQRIFELKRLLQELVNSEGWKQWKISNPDDILSIEEAILRDDFWSDAYLLLQLFEPFALEALRNKGIDEGTVKQLEELIENRWDVLFSPLHATGYLLNPRYHGKGQTKDKVVMRGWKATLERYESESANRRGLREQLSSYWRLEGSLGDEDAVDCRDKMDPVVWWENFGFETPELQTLAIKVLSQVSSIAMCQEVCQEYDFPGPETSNRMRVERVEDLVFVRNNLRLNSQRNGISNSFSGAKNAILCSPSEAKTWDDSHIDQTKVTYSQSIHDKMC
ncbi:putative HAT dimerization domain, ribonuclease H-like domain-containing protein [Rosa chinensis]|uniref:Putative HAT dimerization domain, ribonuclease H-like domain-containing protein n=1 Tax=Rosa chinensis TaxID=74649 RepID=A0A2P6QGD8_ROSCH|nr:putative HAT dimerization domain, ribonuclease H-like domain-containing protein [Rosa chinensis]